MIDNIFLKKALSVGLQAAHEAEFIVKKYFEEGADVVNIKEQIDITSKHYKSPATIADEQAELLIKKIIKQSFPDHGFLGEEGGKEGTSDYTWIIDPIDGTKEFMRGMCDWAILIALQHKEEVVLGISLMPVIGELVYATKGGGCFINNQPCRVSNRSLDDAYVIHERYKYFQRENKISGLEKLYSHVAHYYGNKTPLRFHQLLQGKIEAILGPENLYLYDIAPYVIMLKEAGGKFTTLTGDIVKDERTSFLASNGVVHNSILEIFRE